MINQSTLMINGSRNILADFHPNKCMAAIAIPIIGNEEFNTADLANEDWVDHQSSYVSFTRSGQSSKNSLFLLLLPDVSFILSVENATQ